MSKRTRRAGRDDRRPSCATRAGWALLAWSAVALASAGAAHAGPADHKYLSVRGRVADAYGGPLIGASVEASGTRETSAITDNDGRYQFLFDLGTLVTLRDHPAAIWLRAKSPGWRIRVAGGAPSLAIELSVDTHSDPPQLVSRCNYGLIADVMLDALAPPGDRTAGIQAVFVADRGDVTDSLAPMPAERRSAVLMEPWLSTAPPSAESGRKPAPKTVPAPKIAGSPSAPPAPISAAARDSVSRVHQADQLAQLKAAAAQRESVWYAQHAKARAQRPIQDSMRAIRLAAEDSARRAQIVQVHLSPSSATVPGVAPPPPVPAKPPPASEKSSSAPAKSPAAPAKTVATSTAPAGAVATDKRKHDGADPAAMTTVRPHGSWSELSALQRVQPGGGKLDTVALDVTGIPLAPGAGDCACRVKGTVELEFHHLLSSPMRVEVAIAEVPTLRDTVQLFMGSPRAFDFARVPCGRLSIRVSAFSQRPFEVITPDEVAPFDCRDGGLRQVRIVIAPK